MGELKACRDPDNGGILEAAIRGKATYLVTRDDDLKHDLDLIRMAPMIRDPRVAFDMLYGAGGTAENRAARRQARRSILDWIAGEAATLRKALGASDRTRLDRYLEHVREIERRVQMAEQRDLSAITLPEAPIGELESFDEQVKLMFDLVALAYQANLTRVASYIMVAEGTQRTYNHIGVPDAFHPLSHHANKMESLEKLVRIQKYHVDRFAGFVAKLAATPDGDGSLLDHSLFMYGSNMSNSDKHNNYPLPNILVGGANGRLKGGQQVELPEHTPLTNLLLTVLNKAGLEMTSFADSTGEIAGV